MAVSSSDPTLSEAEPKYLRPRPSALPVEVPESLRLPAEEPAARAAARHRSARARAARQADRARGLRVRQPVVVGVRDRRDPAGARSPSSGVAAFALVVPITIALLVVLGVPDPLVPPDDQGLPDRRRRVHRHPRQLRAAARAGRRRRAAHRLHPHGVGVGRGRHRGARVGLPGVRPVRRADLGRRSSRHRVRQPARGQGVGHGSSPSRPTSSSSTW